MDASDDKGDPPRAIRKGPESTKPTKPRRKAQVLAPVLLAGGIVLGLWGPNLIRPPPPAWTTYATIKGQTRRLRLADRTVLRINGATAIRVGFENDGRRAALDGGEADFSVAPDKRPFQLDVGDRRARVAGGQSADFDLLRLGRLGATDAVLTVRRGQVDVDQPGAKDAARTLGPGDQMAWTEHQPAPPTRKVDADDAFAWEIHRLVYHQAPLSQVLADLNRYVDRPIVASSPAVGALPFTGVVTLDTEAQILKRLQAALPIQARPLAAQIELRPRGPCMGRACAAPKRPNP